MTFRNNSACRCPPDIKEKYTKGGDGRWVGGYFFPPNNTNMTNPLKPRKSVINSLAQYGVTLPTELPESFDWRDKVTLSPILDQARCGSCFAMATAAAMSDRIIVAQSQTDSGVTGIVINPLQLMVCDNRDSGCEGGNPYTVLTSISSMGATDQNSTPFWSDWCTSSCCGYPITPETCENCRNCTCLNVSGNSCFPVEGEIMNMQLPTCDNYEAAQKYKIIEGSIHPLYVESTDGIDAEATIRKIKQDIYTYGPTVASYQVFSDFQNGSTGTVHSGDNNDLWPDTGGIYIYDRVSPMEGGHSVVIVGWGTAVLPIYGKISYWIIKNSWGQKWGDHGYFKMAMSNKSRDINVETSLDVPIIISRTIFGGACSFQMDLEDIPNIKLLDLKNCCFPESGACSKVIKCEPPNYLVEDCSECKKKGSATKQYIFWFLIGIFIILIIIILFKR